MTGSLQLAAALVVVVMSNVQAQIISPSKGSCLKNNDNKTCEEFNYFVEDCYCDKECIVFQDCCEDFYQLDFCGTLTGDECASGSVRLISGGSILEGFVEVCVFRRWRAVCAKSFDQRAANVTCQSLGYIATEDSLNYTIDYKTKPFPGSFYPNCQSGSELQLTDCLIQQITFENCSRQATLRCFTNGTVPPSPPTNSTNATCNRQNCVNGNCTAQGCECFDGWIGDDCTTFVCIPECANGECFGPNMCSCHKGWNGPRCRVDINECSTTDNGGCDHYCNNTQGSYYCSCRNEYRLSNADNKSCEDINECLEGLHSCQEVTGYVSCVNTNGSYYCECHQGYEFPPGGQKVACVEIDECLTAPCEHNCTDAINSYTCSCYDGFELAADEYSCFDISECERGTHNCGPYPNVCNNLIGSFYCSCIEGYFKPTMGSPCQDINECLDHNGGCSDGCNNTKGGFHCFCPEGYEMTVDNRTCQDINECVDNSTFNICSGVHVVCVNNPGSFHCDCNEGYALNTDKRTCSALHCHLMLNDPVNGALLCPEGQVTGSNCTTECDPGYKLRGSQVLTCLSDGSWSDQPPSCQPLQCGEPTLQIPSNGFVRLPCSTDYNSSCNLGCFDGYNSTGSGEISCQLSDTGDVQWINDGTLCQKISPCASSPCLHGECIEVNENDYHCDCTNTFHTGDRCEFGIIQLDIPVLTQRRSAYIIPILAKPSENEKLIMTVKALGFTPIEDLGSSSQPLGTMREEVPLEFTFEDFERVLLLFANRAGRYTLHFSIKVTPEVTKSIYPETLDYPVLVIDSSVDANYFNVLNHHDRLLVPSVCKRSGRTKFTNIFCSGQENAASAVTSSCGWSGSDTGGIVFAYSSASNLYFPLSAIGVSADAKADDLFLTEADLDCLPCSPPILTDPLPLPSSYQLGLPYAYKYGSNATVSSEFVIRDSLAFTFIHTVQQSLLPSWLTINIPTANTDETSLLDSDLVNEVASKNSIQNVEKCQLQTVTEDGRYVILKHDGEVELITETNGENDSVIFYSITQSQIYLYCFAVSLCDAHPAVHVGFPNEASQNLEFLKMFEMLNTNGWNFQIYSLSFRKTGQKMSSNSSYWNGVRENYFPPLPQPDVLFKGSVVGTLSSHGTAIKLEVDGFINYEYTAISDEVDLAMGNGNASLLLTTTISGQNQTLLLDKAFTDGALYYTDDYSNCSSEDIPGIAINVAYRPRAEQSNFFHSLFQLPSATTSCDVSVFLNLNQQQQMNGLSFHSSCLELNYDSLFFPAMSVRALINMDKQTHCLSSDDLDGLVPEDDLGMEIHTSVNSSLKLGRIFTLYPADKDNYALSVGFLRYSSEKVAHIKVMEVTLFDSVFNTSLLIMDNILHFNKQIMLSSFPVNIECTADTYNNWDSLNLEVSGWFDPQANGNLPAMLEDAVHTKIITIAGDAKNRLQQADLELSMVTNQLDNIKRDITLAEQEQRDTHQKYLHALQTISELMLSVQEHQNQVANATGRLKEAQEAVDMLCEIQECELICEPSLESRIEYVDEFTSINSTCYVLDYKTEEVTVPPYYVQKVVWGFAAACEDEFIECVDLDICRNYFPCTVLSLPLISICPAPENRVNITIEYLRPTMCVETVLNRTVERLVSYTNPCGKRVADMACLNRSHECQVKHDQAFQVLEEREEGLILPLQLLSQAKSNLSASENDKIRYELELESHQRELQFLRLLLSSAETQNVSAHSDYDQILQSVGIGLTLSSLLDQHSIKEVFAVTNVTFTSTVFASDPGNQPLPLEVYIATVYKTDPATTVLHYSSDFSRDFGDTQVNRLADFIFQSLFGAESRQKRSFKGGHYKRQAVPDTEEQFHLQCADLETAVSYLLHLQTTLQQKNQYTTQLLQEISKLLHDLGSSNSNSTVSLPPANYTLLETAFGITQEELDAADNPATDNAVFEAAAGVIEEIRVQAERVAADLEQMEFTQWQNDMEALQAASGAVGEYECFGFSDCQLILSKTLQSLLDTAPSSLTGELLKNLTYAHDDFLHLATSNSLSPSQGLDQLSSMLSVAQAMVDMKYWCSSPPQTVIQPELVVNVSRGGLLTLKCEATSTLPLSYNWRKDGIILHESDSTVLTIANMQVSDEGNYTCQAKNDIGIITSRKSMVHTYFLPTLHLNPQPVTTFIGDENGAKFTCNGTARPNPGWYWQFRHSPGEQWSTVPDYQTNQLLIRQPSRANEGQFRCVAYNWHGNITSEPVDLHLLEATFRVTTIPVNLRLTQVSVLGENKKRKRETGDIEEEILYRFNEIFDIGDVTIQGFNISTSEGGEQLVIHFILVGGNVTSENTSMSLLKEILPLLLEAQNDLIQLKEEIQEFFSSETFFLEYNGMLFNNSEDSVIVETTSIVCPAGQQLHENRIHCVDCLAGEHQVLVTENRVVSGQVRVEVVPRCAPCPLNSYQNHVGGAQCQPCPQDHITLRTGATGRQDCLGLCTPNHYSPTGLEPCEPCVRTINYQPQFAETSCLPCLSEEDDTYCQDEPLDVFLSSDTPIVLGDSVTFILNVNKPVFKLRCKISGTSYRDCSTGHVTFTGLKWRPNNKYYIFRADAITEKGEQFTMRRKFLPEDNGRCTVHLINRGVSIVGSNTVRVEFTTTGPVSSLTCTLDDNTIQPCINPAVFSGVESGVHHIQIHPLGCFGKNSKFPLSLTISTDEVDV